MTEGIIYILGVTWRVKGMTKDESAAREALGECRKDLREIHICMDLLPEVEFETLIHEIIHAIWYLQACKRRETEERVATRIATGLASVFKDSRNDELLKAYR